MTSVVLTATAAAILDYEKDKWPPRLDFKDTLRTIENAEKCFLQDYVSLPLD